MTERIKRDGDEPVSVHDHCDLPYHSAKRAEGVGIEPIRRVTPEERLSGVCDDHIAAPSCSALYSWVPTNMPFRASAIVNLMANNALLDRSFAACSHPIRRGILERLSEGELTVGEATRDFGVSKPAISKHLRVLEEAGTIVRVIDGRTHRLRLRRRPLDDAYAWMTRQRELWERKLDTIEEYLREQRETQQSQESQQRESQPPKETR
jgi:DNA-binding transcriptional ArsR family regulator